MQICKLSASGVGVCYYMQIFLKINRNAFGIITEDNQFVNLIQVLIEAFPLVCIPL